MSKKKIIMIVRVLSSLIIFLLFNTTFSFSNRNSNYHFAFDKDIISEDSGLHLTISTSNDFPCFGSIDVPITASGFNNLISLQGSLSWNPSHLRFDSIIHFGPDSLNMSEDNFGMKNVDDGKLPFSWNAENISDGSSLPNGTILFIIRLSILQKTNLITHINFTDDPTPFEVFGKNFEQRSISFTNGNISLNCFVNFFGRIETPTKDPLSGVSVDFLGLKNYYSESDSNGIFKTENFEAGTYIIQPTKANDKNISNGISTIDLAFIQAHILGNLPFSDPLKIIASDANGNGFISALDIILLRRLILGIDSILPGNRIWSFVDSNHVFKDSLNPFPFPSSIKFLNAAGDIKANFIGIKIGDVNYDRNPKLLSANRTFDLLYDTLLNTENPQIITVKIKSAKRQTILGFQANIEWDSKELRGFKIINNPYSIGFSELPNANNLKFSWNDPFGYGVEFEPNQEIFSMEFERSNFSFFNGIRLGSFLQESFDNNFRGMKINLNFDSHKNNSKSHLIDFSIFPNPSKGFIFLSGVSSISSQIGITFLDAIGNKVHFINGYVPKGNFEFNIDCSMMKGKYFYVQVWYEGQIITKKVLLF